RPNRPMTTRCRVRSESSGAFAVEHRGSATSWCHHAARFRTMKLMQKLAIGVLALLAAMMVAAATASAQQQRPNIIVIMGDDIGWFNIGAYHQGMRASRTPNLDRLAAEGMRFTDYYAEASCTAGRANFITGELPIRTGLTTVGQAGAPLGMPDEA